MRSGRSDPDATSDDSGGDSCPATASVNDIAACYDRGAHINAIAAPGTATFARATNQHLSNENCSDSV